MRILHYMDGIYRGGKERRLLQLLRFLLERNSAEIELGLMSREIAYPEFQTLNIKTHYLIRKTKKDWRIFREFYRVCRAFRPDIIHTWDSMTSVYALPAAKAVGAIFVNGMVTDTPRPAPLGKKEIFRGRLTFPFSDVVVGNSLAGLDAYHAPESRRVCIYNGFDFKRLEGLPPAEGVRRDLQVDTPKIVSMVASFTRRKDYDTYIRAAELVLGKRDDVTFLALGDGPELEHCKSLVSAKNRNRVRFLGWVQNVEAVMNASDIGVLTSYAEGISNSILEFMALGKPVVATDKGGTKEILVQGETGYLVPTKEPEQVARRVIELLDDREKSISFGKKGKERALGLFDIEQMGNHFIRLYERLMDGRAVEGGNVRGHDSRNA